MTDNERLEILSDAVTGNVAAVADKMDEYGVEDVRRLFFCDLDIFFPLTEDIRAVFLLFDKTAALIRALEIREKPEDVKDKDVLGRLIAETDFHNDIEANAYFRTLTKAAIEADANEAIVALMNERKRRGL